MIKKKVCFRGLTITDKAGFRVLKIVGCTVRTANLQVVSRFRCARRALRFIYSNGIGSYAFRSSVVLSCTNL